MNYYTIFIRRWKVFVVIIRVINRRNWRTRKGWLLQIRNKISQGRISLLVSFIGIRDTYAYAIFPRWKYATSLYKYSSARGSSRMWGSGKKQLEGKRGKEGWPKIISTNIFVPWRTTGFRRIIHFFFSSLRISDLSIVSRDFCLVRRSPAPSLHRKLANNSRKREREGEVERKSERTMEFQSRSSRWRDSQGFLRLEKFPRYPRLPDESSSVPRSIEKRLVDTWLW